MDLVNIIQTAIRVIMSPAMFFKEMPKTGGFIEPLVFMVVMGFLGSLIQALLSIIGLSPEGPAIGVFPLIIMLTFIIVISGFIAAGIYFVIWRIMGSQESFETAYRCNAYISALIPITAVFSPIPYLNQVITVVLTTLFLVIVTVQVYNMPLKKAWIVFGILGVIFMAMSLAGETVLRRMDETQKDMRENIQEIQDVNNEIHKILV